jgi:4-hydroxy-tetrahydrodipicolinate reductase
MNELRVAIFGITGRMGRAVAMALAEEAGLRLVGASCSPSSRSLGCDAGEAMGGSRSNVLVTAQPAAAVENADVAIDFTLPEATRANLQACVARKCALVIGGTGHEEAARAEIARAAREIPIVMAPNMSLGVNVLLSLVERAARALDASYDVEVFEAHHRNKKDSPSGTALALGRAAANGRGVTLEHAAEYARHGVTGARRAGSIGFAVFRGGDVVGDHTVTFAGIGERIELTHRASDRMAFAHGAVKAAQWVARRAPGLYSMQDVLGLTHDRNGENGQG